jgi:multiple sugar transport system substrate-binding protein
VTALADSGQPLVTTSNWNEIVSVFAQYATDGFRGRRTAQQILGEIQEATAR